MVSHPFFYTRITLVFSRIFPSKKAVRDYRGGYPSRSYTGLRGGGVKLNIILFYTKRILTRAQERSSRHRKAMRHVSLTRLSHLLQELHRAYALFVLCVPDHHHAIYFFANLDDDLQETHRNRVQLLTCDIIHAPRRCNRLGEREVNIPSAFHL